nr:major histocompatibility complex class I-related gene protein-like [Misgurnus anguillicaudatus]XP_055048486.1 major histocompatibility complex class I-related gene protein-like [Misgurnus anguillicaudatus]
MERIFVLLLLSVQAAAPRGSHSLLMLTTYIKGQTPFPQFGYVFMLDDVRVLYYDGETRTFIRRGNTTNEDAVFDSAVLLTINDHIETSFREKSAVAAQNLNKTDGLVFQKLVLCELKDNGEPGQMITRYAFQGSTIDELQYLDKRFTYDGTTNDTVQVLKMHLDISKWRHENVYYPVCIKILKGYLKTRGNQVNRKVKPRVRLLQTDLFSGSRVSCLATGFYPRHINLTLFRDGQPVSDDEITGGDLLPNDDGTYQMRKILEISEEEKKEKHKYTCTATHLSLDNKLDVKLEYDHGTPLKSVLGSVLPILVMVTVAAVVIWRVRKAASKREYSSASTSDESVDMGSKSLCNLNLQE